jgi:hypothetical protein
MGRDKTVMRNAQAGTQRESENYFDLDQEYVQMAVRETAG